MNSIFPYFQKGLPLRSRDLNAIYRRAEEEVRETRTCLQGVGIFYGLKVTLLENGIRVKAGAGVTSQGLLFCLDKDMDLVLAAKDSITTDTWVFGVRPFTDYLDKEPKEYLENKSLIYNELYDKNTTVKDTKALNSIMPFKNKRLVIHFEIDKQELKGCANCDKGTTAQMIPHFLLIDDAEWLNLTFDCNTSDLSTATFSSIPLSISRLGLMDSCLNIKEIRSEAALNDAYTISTKQEIQTAIKAVITRFGKAFNDPIGDTDISKQAVSDLTAIQGSSQYHHDYWRLIVRAYNEFVSTSFAQSFADLPPEGCFPKHLVLGKFNETSVFDSEESYIEGNVKKKRKVRTPLYRPPFDDATDADFATAQTMYYRLMAIVKYHLFGKLPKEGMRITPSRRATYPLSKQAIPFYLNANEAALRTTWQPNNPFKEAILSYDNTKKLQNQPYFDEADFYRIEGHIGQTYQEVKDFLLGNNDNISGEIACQNLPFQVIFVQLPNSENNRVPTLSSFAAQNAGLEHQGGVPAGGTFVIVLDVNTQPEEQRQLNVVADFCLPYWWQKPMVKVVADFTVTQNKLTDGQITAPFTFNAAPSDNAHLVTWSVLGENIQQSGLFSDATKREFSPQLKLTGNELSKNFFIRLEVVSEEGQRDVEITTVVLTQQRLKPIARFIVVQNRIRIPLQGTQIGETIQFKNLASDSADKFEWFVDDGKPTLSTDFSDDFMFEKGKSEKDFVVTLKATNSITNETDIEELTVTIRRDITAQPALPEPKGELRFVPEKSSVLPKGFCSLTNIGNLTCIATGGFGQDGLIKASVVLNILPQKGLGDRYRIQIIESLINPATNAATNTVVEELETTDLDITIRLDKLQWTGIEFENRKKYILKLFTWVHDFPQIERQTDEKEIVLNIREAIVEPVNEQDINIDLVNKDAIQGLMDVQDNLSVVEATAALKALRKRQADYRTALEQAAVVEPNVKVDDKIDAALNFMAGFLPDSDKLEEQMTRWVQLIKDALPSRTTSEITESQQAIVQNLILFLFDKLTDLQATGLSQNVALDLQNVFAKLKTYNKFNIKDLATQWKAEAIRTDVNSATVDALLLMME